MIVHVSGLPLDTVLLSRLLRECTRNRQARSPADQRRTCIGVVFGERRRFARLRRSPSALSGSTVSLGLIASDAVQSVIVPNR